MALSPNTPSPPRWGGEGRGEVGFAALGSFDLSAYLYRTTISMLTVDKLHKQYTSEDGTPGGGVFGASFEVAEGELFTLLGPSGCGKTTTLRSIAGLEKPEGGRVTLAGRAIYDADQGINVAMYERDIGMVFQSYAIWPHMNVYENAAYPLKVTRAHGLNAGQIREKVRGVLALVGLEDYINRPSTQLSGGQQQRLALARALTREPALLLLDEPLSNLDARLREQMRGELKRLQRETGVTAIYVTHDQSEALAISDRIAVMDEGLIMQIGPPKEIYERPTSEFVANFIGTTKFAARPAEIGCHGGQRRADRNQAGAADLFVYRRRQSLARHRRGDPAGKRGDRGGRQRRGGGDPRHQPVHRHPGQRDLSGRDRRI